MPDIFYLIGKWWKKILLLVILAVVVVTIVSFLQPTRYLSTVTAIPANPELTDKASIFNTNIQSLSSSMGSTDELDVMLGTAQLDTVYLFVAQSFNLWDHYKTDEQGEAAVVKSASILKKYTRVIKSDFGELKVKVWDTDKNLAPQLANAIMDKLNSIHQSVQNESNGRVLNNLKASREKIKLQLDSLSNAILYDSVNVKIISHLIPAEQSRINNVRRNALWNQLEEYEKLIGQYQLMFDSKPSALMIVERARSAAWPDKPALWKILAATFFISILFGLLLALIMEKRKTSV
ncbi:MAG: hypothetical protein ABI480_10465 [Chitinophagaceae bacterium]